MRLSNATVALAALVLVVLFVVAGIAALYHAAALMFGPWS